MRTLPCHAASMSLNTCVCRPEHVQIVVLNGTPLFFAQRDGPWYPTLRLLHQYPDMMAKLRADVGAIKFVLSGANIMAPGLTSPGATIHDEAILMLAAHWHLALGQAVWPHAQWSTSECQTMVEGARASPTCTLPACLDAAHGPHRNGSSE